MCVKIEWGSVVLVLFVSGFFAVSRESFTVFKFSRVLMTKEESQGVLPGNADGGGMVQCIELRERQEEGHTTCLPAFKATVNIM